MASAPKFRNIAASPSDPVETWPFEGILAAVERGTLPDWRRLATAPRRGHRSRAQAGSGFGTGNDGG
jgi:hypothetical protein